jgi:competence protein ComEA
MRNLRRLVMAGLLVASAALTVSVPSLSAEEKLININTASAAELAEIRGIGDAKAKAIIEYREKSGPFKSVDDLQNVKGIGEKLLATLRPQVTVGSGPALAPAGVPPAAKR